MKNQWLIDELAETAARDLRFAGEFGGHIAREHAALLLTAANQLIVTQ